jgi:hypothetical protein
MSDIGGAGWLAQRFVRANAVWRSKQIMPNNFS